MSEPYRPSNGTDMMIFVEAVCDACYKERYCRILSRAFAIGSAKQWIRTEGGGMSCTSFASERPKKNPRPKCKKTGELL